jgi:xanthine dehydrogenase accessory factor
MINRWSKLLDQHIERNEDCVLVTILSTKGSTPRAVGSKMLVTKENSQLSIGGGHLEYEAIDIARQKLASFDEQPLIKAFSLGASLGQCCGGHVELLFEAFIAPQQSVVVFGAGHVANALIVILGQLPCQVKWIDSRSELFPSTIPDNTKIISSTDAETAIKDLPSNSYALIMTHDHQLDQRICEQLLTSQHCAFIGLIGSETKWKKFKLRLTRKAFSEQQIEKICCPVGDPNLQGKLPMEVAISISAQFINYYQHQNSRNLSLVSSTKRPSVLSKHL